MVQHGNRIPCQWENNTELSPERQPHSTAVYEERIELRGKGKFLSLRQNQTFGYLLYDADDAREEICSTILDVPGAKRFYEFYRLPASKCSFHHQDITAQRDEDDRGEDTIKSTWRAG